MSMEPKNEHDIPVECCRCRNKHMESDRVESEKNKNGFRTLVCPRCGAHNYYRLDKESADENEGSEIEPWAGAA